MSLIEDALRRVQDPVTSPVPPVAAPAPKRNRPQAKAEPVPAVAPAISTVHSWPLEASAETKRAGARPAPQEAPIFIALLVLGLTAVLAIAAAFWMGRRLKQPSQATAVPAKVSAASSVASVVPVSSAVPAAAAAEPAPAPVAPPRPAFALSGVVKGLGQPCAMINNGIICLGEQVGGAKLVKIDDRSVTLEQADGSELVLHLPR